jgi:hypothetical protein
VTWVAYDIRDQIVDFLQPWSELTGIAHEQLLSWIELSSRKFRDWRSRYGKANEHNHLVPRDHWLEAWEKEKIIAFYHEYPLEGWRTFGTRARRWSNKARCSSGISHLSKRSRKSSQIASMI